MSRNLDWMADARCIDEDPEIFFPSIAGPASRIQAAAAAQICQACPVQPQCGAHRARTGATFGVWGGSAVKESTGPSSGGPQGVAQHGSRPRYQQHLNDGEKPCQACWSAHSRAGAPNGRSKVKRWTA